MGLRKKAWFPLLVRLEDVGESLSHTVEIVVDGRACKKEHLGYLGERVVLPRAVGPQRGWPSVQRGLESLFTEVAPWLGAWIGGALENVGCGLQWQSKVVQDTVHGEVSTVRVAAIRIGDQLGIGRYEVQGDQDAAEGKMLERLLIPCEIADEVAMALLALNEREPEEE